jgi:mono/diheme cytochrome c family protein
MRRGATVALVVVGAAFVFAGCASGTSHGGRGTTNLDPVALGRRIFDRGTDSTGQPISRTGGTGMMMQSGGCASCHGTDGHGRTTPMYQAPDITYANLTDPKGMREVDGSRGHVYTDASIRRAVTEGIGADGDELSTLMPRWHLSGSEWNALLAYLQTLR